MNSHLSTSQADLLAVLCKSWLDGEPGAGPPLLDLLEECGWPLEWINWGSGQTIIDLRLPGEPLRETLASVFSGDDGWKFLLQHRGGRSWESEHAKPLAEAKAAAEAALRRVLAVG